MLKEVASESLSHAVSNSAVTIVEWFARVNRQRLSVERTL
jgi:hypothetical protein